MASEAVRKFNEVDYNVLDKARIMVHQYSNYKGPFQELDSDVFHEGFLEELAAKVDLAENTPSDDVLLKEQVMQTVDVTIASGDCADTARSCKWYIKKASKKRKSFVDLFRYSDLDSASKSPAKMITFMENFLHQVNKYLTELTAEGLPEGKHAEIEADLEELKAEERCNLRKNQKCGTSY